MAEDDEEVTPESFSVGDEVWAITNHKIRGHIVAIEQYVCKVETEWQPEPITMTYSRIERVPAGQ